MGQVEVNAYDQNHIPISGVPCQLFLKNPLNDVLEDTQVTDSIGRTFLDLHHVFCIPLTAIFKITATYNGVTQTIENLIANLDCTLPVQTFIFQHVGGCPNGCPSGYVCVNNQCVSTGGCSSDADCAPGYHCANGQCVPIISGCTQNSQCPTSYHCLNGLCVQNPIGGGSAVGWIVALAGVGLLLYYASKEAGKGLI